MNDGTVIFLILFLIVLNGVFALSEIAIVSSRRARLQQKVNEGDLSAMKALKLAENPSTFLSTVQVGITLISVTSGAVGGSKLSENFGIWLGSIFKLNTETAHTIAFTIVVVLITLVSIVIGELIPKRLALHKPEEIARIIAGPMEVFAFIFSPMVSVLSWITDMIMKLMGVDPLEQMPVTEEELQVLLDQGTQAGVFEESEQDMVEGVFSLNDRRVFSVMTPRSEIAWLDINDSADEIKKQIEEHPFSRYPVCADSLDNVLGVIEARDLLLESLQGQPLKLKHNLQPPVYIPETALASKSLEMFKFGNAEIMLVVDEFGSTQGVITVYDILEEIVGTMDNDVQATQRQDGSWLLDGMMEIDNFKEIFNVNNLPEEDEYETLGGFMMLQLGKVPQVADKFAWKDFSFEVIDMDGKRVDKILVVQAKEVPDPTADDARSDVN